MAKDLSTATRIGTDADFVNGDLVDETIGTQGTLLDTTVLQDVIQFFQKALAKAGITANGDFDNEANGYQLLQAIDQRNDTTKARIFNFNARKDLLAVNSTAVFYFPYSYSFENVKFNGMVSINNTSINIDDILDSGSSIILLHDDTNVTVDGYSDRIEVTLKSAAPAASFVNISTVIFGQFNS